jgi:hypothetical protein
MTWIQEEERGFLMIAVRTIQWIAGIAGLIALTLGLLFWIANIDLISIHMLLGILVALSLLILGIVGAFTKGLRVLGIIGLIYAPLMFVFGLRQATILVGDLHWIIQTAHLLVGLGALALIGIIGTRYGRMRKPKLEMSAPAS